MSSKSVAPKQYKNEDNAIQRRIRKCSSIVFKNYLPYIAETYTVKPFSSTAKPEETVAIFDISKLVLEEKDNVIDKLKNVYHLLAYTNNSIALIIHRKHDSCKIGLAVGTKKQDSETTIKVAESVRDAVLGNFPGSICGTVSAFDDESNSLLQFLNNGGYQNDVGCNSVAIASNIASEFSENFISQGIEKIIDGIIPATDKDYTIVILGESCDNTNLEKRKAELSLIYTGLSPFAKRQENWSISEGKNWCNSFNIGFFGFLGGNRSNGKAENASSGASVEIKQYEVVHTLDIIEKQMERMEKCAALGIWNTAAYVFSSDCQLSSEVAHMYMSLTQGNESFYEKSAINIWNAQKSEDIRKEIANIACFIKRLSHPIFVKNSNINDYDATDWPMEIISTSTVSGAELALALNLPRKSVPGLVIIECASFGREISSYNTDYSGNVQIGHIHHMHCDEEKEVELDRDSLASHIFVTGSTGSGKSNTVYTLLDSIKSKYMVIEPTKGEYKYAFEKTAKVYGTNAKLGEVLKINPFAFYRNIHVYEHIDRLLDVFNVCWPMYAAMPAVLKDAIIKAYEICGWNLITSENPKGNIYPTFSDVCDQIDSIIKTSDYSEENKGNYRGSLKTRLTSLTNGINQLIFCSGNLSDQDLFENNIIVDLSRVGSSENKSLIMGLLIIRLQEYRMSENSVNSSLRHVTVLEEAHHLLRKVSSSGSDDSSNLTVKSVEMLANAIAEMRTYGEGFIIVDQAPGLLDMSVIRNTNTKIIHRLPDLGDRELVGRAANLNDAQIRELARLQRGVAAIYQNEWVEPVLCRVKKHELINTKIPTADGDSYVSNKEDFSARRYINSCVYDPNYLYRKSDLDFIDCLEKIQCDGVIKSQLIDYFRTPLAQKQDLWQRLAFRYFGIEHCFNRFSKDTSAEEWQSELKDQLGKFSFISDVTLSDNSKELYSFIQLMTFESLLWMDSHGLNQPEKCLKLKDCMSEFKNNFVN